MYSPVMETVLIAVCCYPTTLPHVAATVEAFIVSWEECFFPVDISVCLRYQPSCHNYLHLAIVFFTFVAAKIRLERWKRDCHSATNFPVINKQKQFRFFSLKISTPCKLIF
jgi:hypothetical protein